MVRLVKPAWVQHANEKNNKCPIYSLSVHPDGTRLATGGLDHKVKIWSTLPILDETADTEANPKLLCTMTTHSGSVLAVRWAHSGRFLASGSDDMVLVIWGIDPEAGGKVWGSNIVNVENWKPLTRLVGHTSDIIDVAWSRDDTMLASVGLDNSIFIWDAQTSERIHRITGHEGFVKGVTWDPVGNFLATQSDDKSVRVWNTDTWQLETTITEPFKSSPSSTFFRRLSWSPDGAFIAASNAMNGPIFVGAVIEREHWSSDVCFVGHANTIQVAAFNPRLFFRKNEAPSRATASTMLALGSNDFSISIWRNILHKPIVVLKEVFGRNLMDLCWSQDGLHLYGCSEDGTVCAIEFDASEFPEISGPENTETILKEFGYKSTRQPRRQQYPQPVIQETSFGQSAAHATSKVNTIQPRKNKSGDNRRLISRAPGGQTQSQGTNVPKATTSRDAFAAAPVQTSINGGHSRADMLRDAPSRADFGSGVNQLEPRGSKRKAVMLGEPSGRSMASTRPRLTAEVRELRAPRAPASGGSGSMSGKMLGSPQIQSVLRATPKDGSDEYYLEAENATTPAGKNKVTFLEDGAGVWLDYLPSAVLAMAVSDNFCAVACEDGNLFVYSHAGRHLFSVKLESPCFDLAARGKYLFVVTTNCQSRVYDVPSGSSIGSPSSIAHLVEPDIDSVDVRLNGTAVVITAGSTAYAHDPRLQSWVPICDKTYLSHESSAARGMNGPLADIEQQCRSRLPNTQNGKAAEPEWWDETQHMGIMSMRIRASELLGSKDEYKYWLLQHATFLGEQEFVGRAEELLKDLIGPLYCPGKESTWKHEILGYKKRDLALTVSATMLRANQAMAGVVNRYQAILQAIADEENDI